MSSFNASAKDPRPAGALTRSLCALGLTFALSTVSIYTQAACQYQVTGQWSTGFTASVKITNDTAVAVSSWNLGWQYAGDNRITSGYDAIFSGTNPYTIKNASWNGTIQPNQSLTFGFQGTKGAAAAEVPVLTGSLCGTVTTSSASSGSATSISSSSRSSSSSSITPSSSSIAPSSSSSPSSVSSSSSSIATAAWTLNTTNSYLNFATTKNTHNLEVHNFTAISGDISGAGMATLTIDLNTVNTGVALRDQRMRDLLFETVTYPTATVTVAVPATLISGLAVGQVASTDISASLNLHGVTGAITTRVSVQKLSASRVLVQSIAPVLVKAGDYSLTNGVEALRAAVGIASISVAVPVDFALVFDAR
jgi:polyisoprenoid-binding protein YceI